MICHGGTVLNTQKVLLELQSPGMDGKSLKIAVPRVPNASLTTIDLKLNRQTKEIIDIQVKNDVSHLDEQQVTNTNAR